MEVNALSGNDPNPNPQPKPGDGGAHGAGSDQAKLSRPEWLPENYFDAEKGAIKLEDFGKHYGELAGAAKTEADRLAAYPSKVEELKFDLPAELKLPEGLKIDDSNPTFVGFRKFIFDNRIDPKVGSQMLGMYAAERASEVDAINKRIDKEREQLGPNHAQRVAALRSFLDAKIGQPLSKAVMSGVFLAAHVEGMEKLMLAMSNQDTQNPPGGQRDGEDQPAPQPIEKRLFPDMK